MAAMEESAHERIVRLLRENAVQDDNPGCTAQISGNANITLMGSTIMLVSCPNPDSCPRRDQQELRGMLRSVMEMLRVQIKAANENSNA